MSESDQIQMACTASNFLDTSVALLALGLWIASFGDRRFWATRVVAWQSIEREVTQRSGASCWGECRITEWDRRTRRERRRAIINQAATPAQSKEVKIPVSAHGGRLANDVGYESEPSFNRTFKEEFGVPPA